MERKEFERKFKEILEKYGSVDIAVDWGNTKSTIASVRECVIDTRHNGVYFFNVQNNEGIDEIIVEGYVPLSKILNIKRGKYEKKR